MPKFLSVAFLFLTATLLAQTPDIVWPTNASSQQPWRSPESVLQPTASGEPESGGFGCVRSNGYRFHEGTDIKPTKRDGKGEAADEIYAAMDGTVRHINTLAGESSYGRYIVIEHADVNPNVYTLYAHLSRIAPGLRIGDKVKKGQTIATMGRTAGGYSIPRDRAHLHFEIGLWMSRDFQSWYSWKKFGSPNQHGLYNGMNLLGVDAIDFFRSLKSGRVSGFADYFAGQEMAVRIRIATMRVPDFIQRYPVLQTGERPAGLLGGWEVCFNKTGLPYKWTPLAPNQVAGMRQGEYVVVETNDSVLRANHCKDLIKTKRGRKVPGKDLETVLELVFGLR